MTTTYELLMAAPARKKRAGAAGVNAGAAVNAAATDTGSAANVTAGVNAGSTANAPATVNTGAAVNAGAPKAGGAAVAPATAPTAAAPAAAPATTGPSTGAAPVPVVPEEPLGTVEPPALKPQGGVKPGVPMPAERYARKFDGSTYGELLKHLREEYAATAPETAEEARLRQRRERRERVISGIADATNALSNLYFTTRGAADTYNPAKSLTAVSEARTARAQAARQTHDRTRLQYAQNLYNLEDQERGWRLKLQSYLDGEAQRKFDNGLKLDKNERDRVASWLNAQLMDGKITTEKYKAENERLKAQFAPERHSAEMKNLNARTNQAQQGAFKNHAQGVRALSGDGRSGDGGGSQKRQGKTLLGNYAVSNQTWNDDSQALQLFNHLRGIVEKSNSQGAKKLFEDATSSMKANINLLGGSNTKGQGITARSVIRQLLTANYEPGLQRQVGEAIAAFDRSVGAPQTGRTPGTGHGGGMPGTASRRGKQKFNY